MKVRNYILLLLGLFFLSLLPVVYFLSLIDSFTDIVVNIVAILLLLSLLVYSYWFQFRFLAKITCPNCQKSIVFRKGLRTYLSINRCRFCKTSFDVKRTKKESSE